MKSKKKTGYGIWWSGRGREMKIVSEHRNSAKDGKLNTGRGRGREKERKIELGESKNGHGKGNGKEIESER